MMKQTGETKGAKRRRKQRRTPFEYTFAGPLSHPFLTAFVVLPAGLSAILWCTNNLVGESGWPPPHYYVELCIIYVNTDRRLRDIEDSRGSGFVALQENLLKRIEEGARFILPAERQGEMLKSYDNQFSYRILSTDGEDSQRIRARCETDSGRFRTTVYDVSPDLILPISFQTGFLPLIVAAWSYPIMGLVVLPILYIAGRRTRRRLKRRRENQIAEDNLAPIELKEDRESDRPRRERRRKRKRSS